METQDVGKTACSSDDVIQSVTKQLKFYLHVRRREDGFDASPSYIPRKAFPSLLPRPILQATRYDVSMKHHFSHSSIRSVLARLQSFQPHKPAPSNDPKTKKMLRTLSRYYRRLHLDHPMLDANQERDDTPDVCDVDVEGGERKRNKVKNLRNGVRTLVRAPPPFVSVTEKQRIMDSTCMLLRSTEMIMEGPRKYYEVGNTKLQRLNRPRPLQFNFMPDVHRNYVESKLKEVPDSSAIKSGRSWYIYDLDGRRHRIAKFKSNNQAHEISA